jgi:hypothetical protein
VLPFTLAPVLLALAGPPSLDDPLGRIAGWTAGTLSALRPDTAAPTYEAATRAVSNWRSETMQDLHPLPVSVLAALLQAERPVVTRCVKLNNYWCIKRARWNGEIGADEEGHVGFASAEHGADAAVMLLRRYYLDYGRKSALDIVRRWAPAECRIGGPATAISTLALKGIGQTLRARWLAAQRARAAKPASPPVATAAAAPAEARPPSLARSATASVKPAPPAKAAVRAAPRAAPRSRVSVVPLRPLPTFRVPDIAVGMGERKVATISASLAPAPRRRQPTPASVAAATRAKAVAEARAKPAAQARAKVAAAPKPAPAVTPPVRLAAAPAPPAASPPPPRPIAACGDETRIRNYASKMVEGLELGPSDDVKLFEADGTPLPNLARVMLSMSAVELGMLRASLGLIDAAIARAAPQLRASASLTTPPAAAENP